MINKIYSSKKDIEVKAVVISVEEKFGTVLIKYLTGDKTGKTANITTSTLKRWWKEIKENNDTDDIMIQKEDPTIEVPDINSLSEIKEIKNEVKTKKEKTSKISRDTEIKNICENLSKIYKTSYFENVKCLKLALPNTKKCFAEIFIRGIHIELRIKSMEGQANNLNYKDGYKYYLPVHIFIDYDNLYLENIKRIIDIASSYAK